MLTPIGPGSACHGVHHLAAARAVRFQDGRQQAHDQVEAGTALVHFYEDLFVKPS